MPYELEGDTWETPRRYKPDEWDDIIHCFMFKNKNQNEPGAKEQTKYPLDHYFEECLNNYSTSEYPPPQRQIYKQYIKGGQSCIVWLDDFVVYFEVYYESSDYVSDSWSHPIGVSCLPRNPCSVMTL